MSTDIVRGDRRRFLIGVSAVALALGAPSAAASSPVSAETLADLRAGRLVIYFRHGATTWSGVDRLEWPRERQRLLSEEGIAQSEQIGSSFRALGLPVGEVLASPFARCRDMAEVAFGRVREEMALIGLLSDQTGRDDRIAYLRRRVSTPTGDAGARIIISHRSNISAVADVALGEGDAVLLRPLGAGRFERLEILTPEDWAALAAAH